jgi:hypothetical protein
MSFVKDNGGPLAIGAVALAIVGGYIELRLPSEAELDAMVDARFVAAGNVPPHRMDRAEEKIEHLEGEDDRIETKLETVARILMEE